MFLRTGHSANRRSPHEKRTPVKTRVNRRCANSREFVYWSALAPGVAI